MSFLRTNSIREQRCPGSIAGQPANELPALHRCCTALRCHADGGLRCHADGGLRCHADGGLRCDAVGGLRCDAVGGLRC
jgi:hypothetical protein